MEPLREESHATDGASITQAFDFGRLGDQITAAGPLAPRILAASERSELEISGSTSGTQIVAWQRFQIRTHANHLVDVRIIAGGWHSLNSAIGLLEDLYYERLTGEPNEWDDTYSITPVPPIRLGATQPFHQLVFVPNSEPEPNWETTQRLINRATLDPIEEQSSISRPEEINRRSGQLAAIGSFGSVLWGLQDYVERSIILSAALTVAALECIRSIRLETVDRYQNPEQSPGRDIDRLEAELTFGAEAMTQINPLLQSLMVDAYHQTLCEAADVLPQAELVSRMLARLRR